VEAKRIAGGICGGSSSELNMPGEAEGRVCSDKGLRALLSRVFDEDSGWQVAEMR
jgi:hypothetical protein